MPEDPHDDPDEIKPLVTEALIREPANGRKFRERRPPEPGYTGPVNFDRADWAAAALIRFAEITGMYNNDDVETTLGDLLADLMHLADREGVDFTVCMIRAEEHHAEELAEEAEGE